MPVTLMPGTSGRLTSACPYGRTQENPNSLTTLDETTLV